MTLALCAHQLNAQLVTAPIYYVVEETLARSKAEMKIVTRSLHVNGSSTTNEIVSLYKFDIIKTKV